jgi:hypothetical protein
MRKFGGKPVQRVHVMLKPVTGACLHEHNFLLGLSIDGLKNLHDIYLFAQSTLERLIDKHLTAIFATLCETQLVFTHQ